MPLIVRSRKPHESRLWPRPPETESQNKERFSQRFQCVIMGGVLCERQAVSERRGEVIAREKVKGPLRRNQLLYRDAFPGIICNFSYSQIIEN